MIIVKKAMIARYHLYDIILKLCRFDKNEYESLRNYMIVLSQNSVLLLTLLLSSALELKTIIKIA